MYIKYIGFTAQTIALRNRSALFLHQIGFQDIILLMSDQNTLAVMTFTQFLIKDITVFSGICLKISRL